MDIPTKINNIIGSRSFTLDKTGMSDSQVICFDDMILKIEKQCEESDNEHQMLSWLSGRLPVPKLLCSEKSCSTNYLLMERVVGEMSCSTEFLCGFIDLGRSGIADKYQDIALCYRSLKHNFEGRYGGKIYEDFNADILFDKLGIEPDWDRIQYYILLDELF